MGDNVNNALWYALLLLIHSLSPDQGGSGEIDLYLNSSRLATVEFRGDVRSGRLYVDGQIIAEYESSARYRQSYMLYPRVELVAEEAQAAEESNSLAADVPAASGSASGSSSDTVARAGSNGGDEEADTQNPQFASGILRPLLFDYTPVSSGQALPAEGESRMLGATGYEDLFAQSDSGQWVLERNSAGLSLFHQGMGIIAILRQ